MTTETPPSGERQGLRRELRFIEAIALSLAIMAPTAAMALNGTAVAGKIGRAVPLAFLMASENHRRERAEWNGLPTRVYAISFGDRTIWGVTAAIIRNLWEQIYRA